MKSISENQFPCLVTDSQLDLDLDFDCAISFYLDCMFRVTFLLEGEPPPVVCSFEALKSFSLRILQYLVPSISP